MVDVLKIWSRYHKTQGDSDQGKTILLNKCFTNCNEEIVEAQKADSTLKQYFKRNAVLHNGLELLFIENESCICHKGRLVLPKPLSCSHVVSPLSSAPWAYPSRRDDEICNMCV